MNTLLIRGYKYSKDLLWEKRGSGMKGVSETLGAPMASPGLHEAPPLSSSPQEVKLYDY